MLFRLGFPWHLVFNCCLSEFLESKQQETWWHMLEIEQTRQWQHLRCNACVMQWWEDSAPPSPTMPASSSNWPIPSPKTKSRNHSMLGNSLSIPVGLHHNQTDWQTAMKNFIQHSIYILSLYRCWYICPKGKNVLSFPFWLPLFDLHFGAILAICVTECERKDHVWRKYQVPTSI